MKKILLAVVLLTAYITAQAQEKGTEDEKVPGSVLLAYYAGRTPCAEISAYLGIPDKGQCPKRKLWLLLYTDSLTGQPTIYKMGGIGTRSGTGKWSIERGMPADPAALVYRLQMGDVSLLLMKGDEQVLFVLDGHKNFMPGNAKFSYTMNRIRHKDSWDNWRTLVHNGSSF